MLRLALPVLAEQSLVMLVGLAETWLAGHYLEQAHLAAVSQLTYVLWLFASVFSAVGIGATALVARYVGAGDWTMASRVTNQALLLGSGAALALVLVVAAAHGPLLTASRLEPEAAQLASRYLLLALPALPGMMLEAVGVACLRGAGRMVAGLVVMVVINLVNVAVGAGLLLGIGPLPELGWDGLAIGLSCGYLVGGLAVLGLLASGRAGLRLRWGEMRLDRLLARRLLWVGLPGGADMIAVVLCHLVFVSIINDLGSLPAAAHGVAIRIESLAYLPGHAFQVAAATLAGQYLGAGDQRRAGESVLMACLVGGGIMVTAGAAFFTWGAELAGLFVGPEQADVARLAVPLLRTVACGMPALALMSILSGGLRGAGDTRWPLVFTFVGLVGVRLPGAWLLTHAWGWGVQGAWYAMVADLVVRCVLVVFRFFHGGWKRIEV
jgi:putative MATE family efflux protein